MDLTRRSFLFGSGAAAGAVVLGGADRALAVRSPRTPRRGIDTFTADPFTLGVASGDPLPSAVVLWTRLAPRPLEGGGVAPRPVPVRWEVATDESFRSVVRRGGTVARASLGHSVHVDVRGLEPDSWYWYRFRTGGYISPVGRTKTAPAAGSSPAALAFAFVSCQNWQDGYFTAYDDIADQDLDFVAHLGDYFYEGGPKDPTQPGSPPERIHNSAEVKSLEDYRNRHALYRDDDALRRAHASFPFIVTWDDHEFDNDYAGLMSENPDDPAAFRARRAAAYQAYYEHMPIRTRPSGPDLQLYRRLRFGDLLNVHVLDTRQYRTDQPCTAGLDNCDGRLAETQTMTGAEQEAWLLDGLGQSQARWDVLAQQTIFAEVDFNIAVPGSAGPGGVFNTDQWDGYVAQRRRITDFLAQPGGPRNPVVITGDIHSSWVNDVRADYDDPDSATVATEFVGTSITSTFPPALLPAVEAVASSSDNPHIKDFDGAQRGYVLCRLDRDRWTSDYRVVSTILTPEATASTRAVWAVEDGQPGAVPA